MMEGVAVAGERIGELADGVDEAVGSSESGLGDEQVHLLGGREQIRMARDEHLERAEHRLFEQCREPRGRMRSTWSR